MPRKKKQPDWTSGELDRSHYVYIHRCKAIGTAFYVGKGKGKRAYATTNRSGDWNDHVANLKDGYEVEIEKDNLTEMEAGDLERELIAKHGKLLDGTGTLVNRTDGFSMEFGEAPFIEIGIELPRTEVEETRFRQFTPDEKRSIVNPLAEVAERWYREFDEWKERGFDEATLEYHPSSFTDLALIVEEVAYNAQHGIKLLHKRQITFQEFVERIEELFDDLTYELNEGDESEDEDAKTKALAVEIHDALKRAFVLIQG